MDPNSLMLIVFLVLMFGMFYFLIIRPQRKRQQEHQALVSSLKIGDKVITIGGIYGSIESMTDDSIVLKIESGAMIRMSRSSIAFREGETTQA
ncbi:MAG: preprotein translocase subunit YajC [Dehalococcoidaceae bacterium]|nr:preprotein translocase subunit YajC [Dehalococcoidaceae bacterium]